MKHILRLLGGVVAAFLFCGAAFAQGSMQQSGPVVPGHMLCWVWTGIVQDCGYASGSAPNGPLAAGSSELLSIVRGSGVPPYANGGSGPFGTNWCDLDAPTTNATGYHFLCFSPNALGGGLITYGARGTAPQLPLSVNLNGTTYQFPFAIHGIVGPPTTVIGDLVTWANTAGTLTADLSSPSNMPVTSTGSSMARTLAARFAQPLNVFDYGVAGDGSTDDTAALNAAIATGANVFIPPCTAIKVTASIVLTTPGQTVTGSGAACPIELVLASSAPVVPTLWVKRAATAAHIDNLYVNANAAALAINTTCASNPYFSQGIIIEADHAMATRMNVWNAFDNGMGVGYVDGGCVEHPNEPLGVEVSNITGGNNGQGEHPCVSGGPGKKGALFDNLTGQSTTLTNGVDYESYTGFIEDFSGGASGTYSNLISYNAQEDTTTTCGQAGTGYGFYIGAGPSTWTNVQAVSPAVYGMWIDFYAAFQTISNCTIKTSQNHAIYIKSATHISLQNCKEEDTAYPSGPGNGIELDASSGPMTAIDIVNNEVGHSSANTCPACNAYGILEYDPGSNGIALNIVGGRYEGSTTPIQLDETLASSLGKTAGVDKLSFATTTTLAENTTEYLGPAGASPSAQGSTWSGPSANCVILGMAIVVSTQPTSGQSYTYTLYKDGSPTALTASVSGTPTVPEVLYAPTPGLISAAAGDQYNVQVAASATAAASQHQGWLLRHCSG